DFPERAAVSPGGGIPGWFSALFVIVAVAGVATTIWRMSVLRSGGLNPFVAREQLEARLNRSLQKRPPEAAERSIEQRLAELEDLHERRHQRCRADGGPGHSVAVADLCQQAGTKLGLPEAEVVTLRRAGLVHGFGRLGVSNSIWDRPGPLSAGQWERVRMYPYLTERMLHQSAALAPLGDIAVQHRERLDGSGYPRGLSGGAISRSARVLGAADCYQSMREPRPHRAARSAPDAVAEMHAEVRAGRLDGPAVDAVLAAAGLRVPRRRDAVAGLTAREVEVLVLLARGLSNKQIAQRLVITPKTAGNHMEHIYAKIGAS